MKYINMDDLTTIIQNRLLIESIEKEEEILAGIEDLVVSEVCAYIGGRYDVGKYLVILRSGQGCWYVWSHVSQPVVLSAGMQPVKFRIPCRA